MISEPFLRRRLQDAVPLPVLGEHLLVLVPADLEPARFPVRAEPDLGGAVGLGEVGQGDVDDEVVRRQRLFRLPGEQRPGVVVDVLLPGFARMHGVGAVEVPVESVPEDGAGDLDRELVVADVAEKPGVVQRGRQALVR